MSKKILVAFLLWLILTGSLYLFGSIISVSFDIREWITPLRVVCSTLHLLLTIIAILISILISNE